MYFLVTAGLCAADPSLHSVQLINLAAVVYDLSFELHRLYMLVNYRPFLMVAIVVAAFAIEWLLERYEADDSDAAMPRGVIGGLARIGRSVGRMLLPAVMGVLISCVCWFFVMSALSHPTAFSAPLVEIMEHILGAKYGCTTTADCVYVSGSTYQMRVHGVYVLSPRKCSDKPVYRQVCSFLEQHLSLHAPTHELPGLSG